MRALARRAAHLDAEIAEHDRALIKLIKHVVPQLLSETGIGHVTAATFVLAWSHHGRCLTEAAFAPLGGAAPNSATSGQTQSRHRLNRRGDRRLNHALCIVAIRIRCDPATRAYVARRLAEAKTHREIDRCLKRYIARRVWRLLEHTSPPLDRHRSVARPLRERRFCSSACAGRRFERVSGVCSSDLDMPPGGPGGRGERDRRVRPVRANQ